MSWGLFESLPLWAMGLVLGAHLALGIGVGVLYFHAIRKSAQLFAEGGRASLAAALTVGRLLLLGGLLLLASREGALPLLVFALGFFIARPLAMRRIMGRA